MIAREIMQTRFHTLSPGDTIAEAVKHFQTAIEDEQRKVFGLMVTDENDHLVGMLSMYDILLFIQPKHHASSAPNRKATRAASMAEWPPPIITALPERLFSSPR